MPGITIGSVFSIIGRFTANAQETLLTTYWEVVATDPAEEVNDDLTVMQSFWTTQDSVGGVAYQYASCLPTSVTNITWSGQVLKPSRFIRRPLTSVHTDGTVTGGMAPQNVAHCLTLRTDVAGRTQVSNKHIGGCPLSFTSGGLITSLGDDRISALGLALTTQANVDVGGVNWTINPAIYHRQGLGTTDYLTNYVTQTTTRVERRRTVGLGT